MDQTGMDQTCVDYSKMCPKYEAAIDLLGKKWTGLIIRVLLGGSKRFRDIKEQIPEMSDKMLADRLKELEALGVVKRTVYPRDAGPDRICPDGERRRARVGDPVHPAMERPLVVSRQKI